jgi:hypothetical protein
LRLQRTIGNQAVLRLLQTNTEVQDQEEARVGEHVIEKAEPLAETLQVAGPPAPLSGNEYEESRGWLPPAIQETLGKPGQPLDQATRGLMELRFGHDFRSVRVHADEKAAESAEALDASAYTVGQDIVLGGDQPSPETREGRQLLTHELAHVVQQSRGGQTLAANSSAVHEQDAEAASTALSEGRPTVHVRQSASVGLARQPKEKNPSASIDVEKRLSLPGVTDPRSSPRYIDKLFEGVNYYWLNGASVFHWQEGGKDQKVGVPLTDLEQDDTRSFLPILEIYDSKEEALKVVQAHQASATQLRVYAFYRIPGNVIMPTCFSIHSTPEFHKLWPGLRKQLVQEAEEISGALADIGNLINPIPGTKVSEHGDLSLSGDPLDWLPLLELGKARRLSKIREAGPITRRLHSGYGVPYSVLGPHGQLAGTSVYVLKDAEGTVLYVGKGETLNRLREHIKDKNKTQWFGEIERLEVWGTGLNNTQALALEESLIAQLEPLHNVEKYPFRKEFGNTMEVGRNLPATQKILKFYLEWGH